MVKLRKAGYFQIWRFFTSLSVSLLFFSGCRKYITIGFILEKHHGRHENIRYCKCFMCFGGGGSYGGDFSFEGGVGEGIFWTFI